MPEHHLTNPYRPTTRAATRKLSPRARTGATNGGGTGGGTCIGAGGRIGGGRRRRWRVAFAGLLAFGVVGCGGGSAGTPDRSPERSPDRSPGSTTDAASRASSGSGTNPTAATLVLDWSPNTNHGGIYLAMARGWYRDAGIDLTIIEPGDSGALQAVATGSAQFAVSSQEELTPARASGVPVVSIAGVIAHNTSSLMSLSSSQITRPRDLVGKRYGGWGGVLEHAIVDALVACDGADSSGIEYVSIGDADYRVGLEAGQYDTVWVYDGWDKIRFDQAGIAIDTIPFADHLDCIPDWYTPLIATSDRMIADNPAVVQAFIDATERGYRAAIDDPGAAAAALLAVAPELDEELVAASANFLSTRFADDPDAWGRQDPAVWARFTEFLDDAGMLDGPLDPGTAFTNRFVDAANESSSPSNPATTG